MTSQKTLYNGALVIHLGADPITDTDPTVDDVPEVYALDTAWASGTVDRCLRQGQWNFAARSSRLEFDSGIEPDYGYRRAFAKPDDFIRVMGVCSDEYFRAPLRLYTYESSYWFCDLDQLYVRYVSNSTSYGLDYGNWSDDFAAFVEGYLALQVAKRIEGFRDRVTDLKADVKDLLTTARGTDAQEQPSKENPRGSWSSSRHGSSQDERGSMTSLTG